MIMEELERLDEFRNTSKSAKGNFRITDDVLSDLGLFKSTPTKDKVKAKFGDYNTFKDSAQTLAGQDGDSKNITQDDVDKASGNEEDLIDFAANTTGITKRGSNQQDWKDALAAKATPKTGAAGIPATAAPVKGVSGAKADLKITGKGDELDAFAGTGTGGVDKGEEFIAGVTAPRLYTSFADRASAAEFLGSQNEVVNSVLSADSLHDRLVNLSNLSKELVTPTDIQAMSPRELLQKAHALDIVNHIARASSREGTGYSMEAFLAMLAGGEVSGGEMGAGDFVMKVGSNTVMGSSKFLKSLTSAKQAASHSSWQKRGNEVHYVVAVRRQETKAGGALPPETQAGQSTGQKSPRSHQIRAIDIYYFIVKVTQKVQG